MMSIESLGLAPNPQFVRPGWIDLTGVWHFGFDDDNVGLAERWQQQPERLRERITLPYPPESRLSGIHETGFHPWLWYARQFRVPPLAAGERLRLCFGAVDYAAIVWVDGVRVGEHSGGQTPFSFDITDALGSGGDHWIVVRANDDPHDAEQPRGKQDWLDQPHGIWYERTSGIWQPVWFEITPAVRIESLRWSFDAGKWAIDYEVALSERALPGSTVEITFEQDGHAWPSLTISAIGRVVCGSISLQSSRAIMHPRAALWSPESPNLIGATVTLRAPGAPDDLVESYLGLRSLETTPRGVLLNGSLCYLRMVLHQAYWPESQLVAPSPEALEREADLILALGFNGARIHQKVEDPRFLYHADRKGLLLWGEMANAFTYSDRGVGRLEREWREVVTRDRNHPSIIAWVPYNESWGVNELSRSDNQKHAVAAAYHQTHQLDGSRPVVGNDGWEHVEADLFTIHDYSWNDQLLNRRYRDADGIALANATHFPGARPLMTDRFDPAGKPVLVTEYGGVSYAPESGEEWYGYGKVKSQAEFVERYRELTGALTSSDLLAGFCYTQLADTLQETNGLLTESREPKAPFEVLKTITQG
jgi:beta-galactosidase/beta-glucuronidase